MRRSQTGHEKTQRRGYTRPEQSRQHCTARQHVFLRAHAGRRTHPRTCTCAEGQNQESIQRRECMRPEQSQQYCTVPEARLRSRTHTPGKCPTCGWCNGWAAPAAAGSLSTGTRTAGTLSHSPQGACGAPLCCVVCVRLAVEKGVSVACRNEARAEEAE